MSTYVITGVTGQVAETVATTLAADHEVIGLARFTDAAARHRLEAVGVRCVPTDLLEATFDGVPDTGCRRGAQLRGHQGTALGRRPAGQRTGRRAADGPRPTRGVPALLVDRRVRPGRRHGAGRDRCAGRQPPPDHADLLHLEDRGRAGRRHHVPPPGDPDHHRPAERALRRGPRRHRQGMARVPHRHDGGGHADPRRRRPARTCSTPSNCPTSPPPSPRWSARPRCRRPR